METFNVTCKICGQIFTVDNPVFMAGQSDGGKYICEKPVCMESLPKADEPTTLNNYSVRITFTVDSMGSGDLSGEEVLFSISQSKHGEELSDVYETLMNGLTEVISRSLPLIMESDK